MPAVKTSHNIAIMPERSRLNHLSDRGRAAQSSSCISWRPRSRTSDIEGAAARRGEAAMCFSRLHSSIFSAGFCHSFTICKIISDFSWNLLWLFFLPSVSQSVCSLFTHLHFLSFIPLSSSILPPICFPLCAPPWPLSVYSSRSPSVSLFLSLPPIPSSCLLEIP